LPGAVVDFVEAPGGSIWVGRNTGIDLHAASDGALLRSLGHDVSKPDGLAGNQVTSLLTDRAGAIWIGGLGGGLQRHDPKNRSIWLRDAEPGGPLADADVRSLLVRCNGEIWAATPGGGVAVMDHGLNVIGRAVQSDQGHAGMPPTIVNTMTETPDGRVWLGSESVLLELDATRHVSRGLSHGGGLTHHLLSRGDGSLWAGTQDGLYRVPAGGSQVQPVLLADGAALRGDVFVLAESADGTLWAGGVKGLFFVPPGGDTLMPVDGEDGAALGYPTVIGLLVDRQQKLWVDTAVAGLHRMAAWDGRRARFDAISVRHGVVSRPFGVNLLEDSRGRIWSHLYVYDPARDQLDELTPADGVTLGTGWFRSYAKTADNRMLFGGSKGVLVVEPERFDLSVFEPVLIATELRINGIRRPVQALPDGLQIAHDDRSFSLRFAALDYSDPGRVRYAYMLEGFDPDWIQVGADLRQASYGNLSPGSYKLHVRATNRNGVWSRHEIVIPVQVHPAWWQTGWAALAAVALLVLLFFGGLRWTTHRLYRRQRVLALKVRERTADLHAVTLALRRESEALAEASLTDPLTGLRNRRFLVQQIDADIALALRRHESPGGVGTPPASDAELIFFVVDIDYFKAVNDRHGHAAGDAVIQQMRDRLQTVFRDSDYLVRWGGEEFLIVARGTTRLHAAELAERARVAVAERPFDLDDGTLLTKTCSVGFCCFPLSLAHPAALSWSDTVKLADGALLLVKRGGRNGWLGVLSARSDSAEDLRANARRPLEEWQRGSTLDCVGSANRSEPARSA
jgi:diguanylate cyclase (GGDEF)-like protein